MSAECYASLDNNDLVRAVETKTERHVQVSNDDGASWATTLTMPAEDDLGDGRVLTRDVHNLYLDPDHGVLICVISEMLDKAGAFITWADGVGIGPRTLRYYTMLSRDGGRTWSEKQRLIETGHDAEHWARDAWFGRSGISIVEGRPWHKTARGEIVAPAYLWPTDEQIAASLEDAQCPAELRTDARYFALGLCLLAKWRDDLSGLEWESGGLMELPWGYTGAGTCGSDEPAVAFLDDGRWFATLRLSTGHKDLFKKRGIPILPYGVASTDQGRTWGHPQPLHFDDGTVVFAPSSYPEFVRHSASGKWYWIGNILDQPVYGECDPRHPLSIAELDPATLTLKRDTVTVIQAKEPDDLEWIRYSNFRTYERRDGTGFTLLMNKSYCEFQEGFKTLPRPTFRYHIRIPT